MTNTVSGIAFVIVTAFAGLAGYLYYEQFHLQNKDKKYNKCQSIKIDKGSNCCMDQDIHLNKANRNDEVPVSETFCCTISSSCCVNNDNVPTTSNESVPLSPRTESKLLTDVITNIIDETINNSTEISFAQGEGEMSWISVAKEENENVNNDEIIYKNENEQEENEVNNDIISEEETIIKTNDIEEETKIEESSFHDAIDTSDNDTKETSVENSKQDVSVVSSESVDDTNENDIINETASPSSYSSSNDASKDENEGIEERKNNKISALSNIVGDKKKNKRKNKKKATKHN